MWLQLYNYKNYIRLINVGLGYNRFYINITTISCKVWKAAFHVTIVKISLLGSLLYKHQIGNG